jgi:hypothetical protein
MATYDLHRLQDEPQDQGEARTHGPDRKFNTGVRMKIAICGWGSLVWDRRDLPVFGEFKPGGPRLPLEFSRVSGGRDRRRRLTLVIDEENGAFCDTYVGQSASADLDAAVRALAQREGMWDIGDVGCATRDAGIVSPRARARHAGPAACCAQWLGQSEFDAIIWTALPSNFAACVDDGAAFTVQRAIAFLAELPGAERILAFDYIRRAPSEIETPLRRAASARWPDQLEDRGVP